MILNTCTLLLTKVNVNVNANLDESDNNISGNKTL